MDRKMTSDRVIQQRIGMMAELFKNSLVYTMVMQNVDRVIENRSGSVTLLITAFMVIALLIHHAESKCEELQGTQKKKKETDESGADTGQSTLFKVGIAVVLLELAIFMLNLGANACVQFLSNLIAHIASNSINSDEVWWTIVATGITGLVAYIGIIVSRHILLSPSELNALK